MGKCNEGKLTSQYLDCLYRWHLALNSTQSPKLTLLMRCRLAVAIRDSGRMSMWCIKGNSCRGDAKTGCKCDHGQDRHVDVDDDFDLADPSIFEDPAVDLAQLEDATVKQTGLKGHSRQQYFSVEGHEGP